MINYFTDPVLFAPTIGSMLMCWLAGFVGTFSVLKKQSLVGEAVSHACYPGVIVSLLFAHMYADESILIPLVGAGASSLLGMYCIEKLVGRYRIYSDSALCFVLASFFGISLVVLSCVQTVYPALYRELQSYLFGQAATQTTVYIYLYSVLGLIIVGSCMVFYRPIKATLFDPAYAKAIGIQTSKVHILVLIVTVLAVVVGIRALGVVLMSSMLIFPAVSGRLWTSRLEIVLLLASLFGMASGFFGVVLSHEMSQRISVDGAIVSFPTGPMIVLTSALLFCLSALLSPERGIIFRYFRRWKFQFLCRQENLLKVLWKIFAEKKSPLLTKQEIQNRMMMGSCVLCWSLFLLQKKGWLKKCTASTYELTASGMLWGRKIVRLHRLWEVYLVEYCGLEKERVHPSAEEMEHIITPEIEQQLEKLLHYPKQDPHKQPIPEAVW